MPPKTSGVLPKIGSCYSRSDRQSPACHTSLFSRGGFPPCSEVLRGYSWLGAQGHSDVLGDLEVLGVEPRPPHASLFPDCQTTPGVKRRAEPHGLFGGVDASYLGEGARITAEGDGRLGNHRSCTSGPQAPSPFSGVGRSPSPDADSHSQKTNGPRVCGDTEHHASSGTPHQTGRVLATEPGFLRTHTLSRLEAGVGSLKRRPAGHWGPRSDLLRSQPLIQALQHYSEPAPSPLPAFLSL